MPLQGSLKDFGIVEILQLIASQEKSGVLRLNGDVGRESLVFEGGDIISAWDPRLTNRDPFREFLIRREIVPRESLAQVLKAEIRSPLSFAEILLRLRAVGHGDIQEAFAEHIQEKIDDLVLWKRGSFEFIQQESVAAYAPGIRCKIEGLLMEAVRRVDEGTGARVRPETILARASVPASEGDARAPLSPTAEQLLHHLDGAESLAEIMRRRSYPRGEALSGAAELLEKGWAVVVAVGPGATPAKASGLSPAQVLVHTGFLAGVLLVSILGFRWMGPPAASEGRVLPEGVASELEMIREKRGLVALRASLEISRSLHGRYPKRLGTLVDEGLLHEREMRTLEAGRYVYYVLESGSAYRLEARDAGNLVRRPPPGS